MLEFNVIRYHVKRDKARFIARLERNLRHVGECIVATGTADRNGYPRMNFRYKGHHVTIHTMRVIAILRNCAPIPAGHDVAHSAFCFNRCCVLHTELQHYGRNANTYANRNRTPF
jgi:hypothetical protein